MATENQVVIVGNLTRDPELRYTPNGSALVKFGVAVSRRYKDEATGQWKDAETSFFDVTAWRQLAENVAESLNQGRAAQTDWSDNVAVGVGGPQEETPV